MKNLFKFLLCAFCILGFSSVNASHDQTAPVIEIFTIPAQVNDSRYFSVELAYNGKNAIAYRYYMSGDPDTVEW